jgi:type IV fimbrial biogenesis protein FimT
MKRAERGLTLIELMVTVAIIAIMLALAVPSFGNSARASRERGAVQKLAQDFAWARSAAAAADASTLGYAAGVPVITMAIAANCTWTTAVNGTRDAAHSMDSTTLGTLAPGASCAGTNGLALPATITFSPQGYASASGSFAFTGTTQTFSFQILYSGSMLRTNNGQS